jgi:hypothetical protein
MGRFLPKHTDPLFKEQAHRALEGLGEERDLLKVATRLKRSLEPSLARRCAELHELRFRSRSRFIKEAPLFMTASGLSRASSEAAANARAAHLFSKMPHAWVSDATCGIGADSLALARAGAHVISSEIDPFLVACSAANLTLYGHPARVTISDCLKPTAKSDALFLDPDRRPGGVRTMNPAEWTPSLSQAMELAEQHQGACLKLAPAMDVDGVKPSSAPYHWQWVSVDRSLVELCLWTGELSIDQPREALLIRNGEVLARFSGHPIPCEPIPRTERPDPPYLHDPDPCLVRSRLLGTLAAEHSLRALHPMLALLVGDSPVISPFLDPFRVLGSAPLDRRRVRALLRANNIGSIEVRKRGHPDRAEVLAKRFKGPGEKRGILFIARLDEGHRAYLAEPALGRGGGR